GKFSLVPFRWDVSCPALEELWLQDSHSVNDLRAILQGCPALKQLMMSAITYAPESEPIRVEDIYHPTLETLTLVSDIPMALVLKYLKFPQLKALDLSLLAEGTGDWG
ncbi:hypothetical protein BDN72DRAFT_865552, partial [Pluteus cervinus]